MTQPGWDGDDALLVKVDDPVAEKLGANKSTASVEYKARRSACLPQLKVFSVLPQAGSLMPARRYLP